VPLSGCESIIAQLYASTDLDFHQRRKGYLAQRFGVAGQCSLMGQDLMRTSGGCTTVKIDR